MLSLVHPFAPTSVFSVQVHKTVASRYEGGLTSAATPSALALAMAPSIGVVQSGSAAAAAPAVVAVGDSSNNAAPMLLIAPQQVGTMAFARDLFLDYLGSQLQPQLRQRWVQRFPAFTRSLSSLSTAASSASTADGSDIAAYTSVEDLLAATTTTATTTSNNGGFQQQQTVAVPKEFVVPLEVSPIISASSSSVSSSFITLEVRVLDSRVASHLFTAISRHQFVALQTGKLMMMQTNSGKGNAAKMSGTANAAAAIAGEGGDNEGDGNADDDDNDDEETDPSHFNMDSYLFSKLHARLSKGAGATEDKARCSPQYHKEVEAMAKSGAYGEDDTNDSAEADADNDNANTKKTSSTTAAAGAAQKRGREEGAATTSTTSLSSHRPGAAANPIRLTSMGKGPFFAAIGDSITALTAWIVTQVHYIGALTNDEEVPSPFAFAVYKLLSMKLLPNDIAVSFCAHSSNNFYIRAVGVAAARYSFPPEELAAVLVPTLDGYVELAPSASSPAPSSSSFAVSASSLPSVSAFAAAASARFQSDVTTSPTADEVRAFALLIAEMGLDPDAAVCELWFPKYHLVPSKKYSYSSSDAGAALSGGGGGVSKAGISSSISMSGTNPATILLEALALRLQRYHEGIRRQKELLASSVAAAAANAAAAAAAKAEKKKEGGGGAGASQPHPSSWGYGCRGYRSSGVGGSGAAAPLQPSSLSLRQLRELTSLKQRENEMRNLSLIDTQDDAFDVATDDDDDDDGATDADATDGNATAADAKPTAALGTAGAAGAAAVGGYGGGVDAADDDDEGELFKRAFRAEAARRALATGALGGFLHSGEGGAGTGGAHHSLHMHANRVAMTMLGMAELSRADDDLYLQF